MDGIIDDFTRVQRSRKKSVLSIEEVPQGSLILSVSTGSPLEVKHRLDALGFENVNYLSFYRYSGLDLPPPPFMEDFREDFLANRQAYETLYEMLADQKSQEIFTRLINFKISFDLSFMEGFVNDHSGQYFDFEILPAMPGMHFVDGGGYVGDTTQELLKHYPDLKKIYFFEPIAQHMKIAQRELSDEKRIEFFPIGLSKEPKTLYAHEEKSFSSIYGQGSEKVTVDALDNVVRERVDYIKLDIEGAEQDALLGAKETILKYHPVLAVSIYHKAEDWHKIPQIILGIRSDYRLYLRHYMEGIFETVLYFIPA